MSGEEVVRRDEYKYVHVIIWCNVIVNPCVTVAISSPQSFVSVARVAVINISGQGNYMGEVSRLLVASPGLRPMETFLLIVFSGLIGLDAPYYCFYFSLNIIILFSIIIFQMVVLVLSRHWGSHLH